MKDSTTVQLDKEYYIAVVNKASDEVAKILGCSLTAPQIAFLKTVVRPLTFLPLVATCLCTCLDEALLRLPEAALQMLDAFLLRP